MVSATDMHARASSRRRSFSPAGMWRPSLLLKSTLLFTLLVIPLVVPSESHVAVAGYAAAAHCCFCGFASRRTTSSLTCRRRSRRIDAGCCLAGAHASRAKATTTLGAAERTHESSDGETRKGQTGAAAVVAAAAAEDDGPPLPPLAPTTKRLFLVRHGEVINPGGPDRPVYYGGADVPLSPLGEAEARAAASYLRRFDLHRVASSPLSRAAFGAREVLMLQRAEKEDRRQRRRPSESRSTETLHELLTFDGFRELDRGDWCGLTAEEIGLDNLARFDACDETVTPGGGGESYQQLKSRVLQARDELLDLTDGGKCSAVVSHLQVTRSLLSDALGMPTHEMAGLKVATASITCIDYCSVTGEQTVHFQSFKPDAGLAASRDMAN